MLCYRCGGHVKDGSEKCPSCGQPFPLGLKPGSIAGFGTGSRRGRAAIEGAPYKIDDAVAARFQIKDHLGAGPLGWVFRAIDTESGISVSLKVLSPRFLQLPEEQTAFRNELSRTLTLEHGNVARTVASGLDGQRPWIASQLLDGLTLRRIMDLRRQKGQAFALHEIEPIVAQIASALDASPVAHGDLKPDNVVVLPDLLKLTDFGLALCLPRAPFAAAQRAAGVQRYFAPEVLAGAEMGGRADVFSLGVMLGEMLSGAPFDAQTESRVRAAGIPMLVEEVFLRAVAPRPDERFASAADLSLALSDAIHGEPPASADDDDVVIEHAQTDPRVRIARALAAQDAERAARSLLAAKEAKAAKDASAKADAAELPPSLQLSLTPLPPLSVPPLSMPPLALEPFSAPPPPASLAPFSAPPSAAFSSPPPAKFSPPSPAANLAAVPASPSLRAQAIESAPALHRAELDDRTPIPGQRSAANDVSRAAANESARASAEAARTAALENPARSFSESPAKTAPTTQPIAGEGVRGHASPEEIARVAARVGATPELLTAETAVRFAPTAPPPALATTLAPLPASASSSISAQPTQAQPKTGDDDDESTELSDGPDSSEPAPSGEGSPLRGKRRGRGRKGKRDEVRGRRGPASIPPPSELGSSPGEITASEPGTSTRKTVPPSLERRAAAETQEMQPIKVAGVNAAAAPPAWAGDSSVKPGLSNSHAELPERTGERGPRGGVAFEKPAELPPANAPRAASSRPAAAPSFGALASEKRGLSVPAIAIIVVVVIAAALFAWNQLADHAARTPPATEPAAASPSTASPAVAAAPAATPAPIDAGAAVAAAAPVPPPAEPPAPAKEIVHPNLLPPREFEEKVSKGGKKSFLERLRERRDASKHGGEETNRAASHRTEREPEPVAPAPAPAPSPPPAPIAASTPAPAPVAAPTTIARSTPPPVPAPAPPAAAKSTTSAPLPTPVAPATAAAPPEASGGIAGVDDDNLLAARDPNKHKNEVASAAAPTSASAAAACPDGMKLIVAGGAIVGTDAADDMRNFGDRSAATVQLKSYCIDLYEWPNAAGKVPKIAAGFSEADQTCKKIGKRLCSEDEWEKACKGPANLRFPYGAGFDPDACNTQDKDTNPRKVTGSGSFANCRSGYGVYDLSGNAAEWTASAFQGGTTDRAVKGGSATRPGFDDRCSSRRRLAQNSHDINVGFRCCAEAK